MLKITSEYNFIGSTILFNDSMNDEYEEHNGKQFIVTDIFFDHETFQEGDDVHPMLYPMIKIVNVEDESIHFNAYCDEIGTQPFIDIFCYGIQSGSRFTTSIREEQNITSDKLHLADFCLASESCNPFYKDSFEYQLFKKGFECMYYK